MNDPIIARPLAGQVAFQHQGASAEWSQAAQLIAIGVGLTGPDEVVGDMLTEGASLRLARPPRFGLDRQRFDWNEIGSLIDESPFPGLDASAFYDWNFTRPYRLTPWDIPDLASIERGYFRVSSPQLWHLASTRDLGVAASIRLLVASLYSESEVVRVAGAVALSPLLTELGPAVESVLVDGLLSDSMTIRALAGNALSAANGDHPALAELIGEDDPGEPEPTRTSITIHGTFARLRSDWWKPGSKMHNYLRRECSDDLYSGTDHFRWDGRYDEACRQEAAADLATWCENHEVKRLDTVYSHSHGGNVALTAAQQHEVRMKLLVLINTPARPRTVEEWDAVHDNVRRIVSMRSRFDLVILGDRSRLKFDSRIRQLLPPGLWFAHGSLLKPKVWRRHNLANEIAYERGLATPTMRRRPKPAAR